jgi:hypothetical protein
MKTTIIFLLVFLSLNVNAIDREARCNKRIQQQIKHAEWGKVLREDLFKNCKSKDLNTCAEPYMELIRKSQSEEMLKWAEHFRNNPVEEYIKLFILSDVGENFVAARIALKTNDSPQQIANDKYMKCISGN